MYLIKTKRSPFYQIAYKNDLGKMTSISTGTKIKSEALIFLSQFKQDQKIVSQLNQIKLSEYKIEYLEYVRPKLSIKYVKSIEVAFNQFAIFTNDKFIDDIDFKLAENFILKEYSSSKFMAAAYYRTLKSAFSKACDWKYISENPFKKFKLPKLPKSLPAFIDAKQFDSILSQTNSQLMKSIFITAFHTGLRLSELLNLRWNMIDLENKIITLKQSDIFTTKNKLERIIPINETLLEVIINTFYKQRNKTFSSLIFTNGKTIGIRGEWVSKCFKRAVRNAGLNEAYHFHTLRHSFASNLIQSGVSLFVVKELLGHKDFTTTQIYSHIQNQNLIDAVKKLDPIKPVNSSFEKSTNKNSFIKFDICLN